MLIRGTIDRIHATDITTRRGPVTLTSVWICDRHDYITPTKQDSVLIEAQFSDDKQHQWAQAITDKFHPGNRVLVVARDDFENVLTHNEAGKPRIYLKIRGLDIAASTLDQARTEP